MPQSFDRVAEGITQRAPKQFLARTWRGGPSKTFATKAQAVAWRRDVLTKRDAGQPIVRKSTATVADECATWLRAERRQQAPATHVIYERRLRCQVQHPRVGLGAVRLTDLTWERVEQWMEELEGAGVGVRTVNQAKSTLAMVLDGAMKATPPRLGSNPVRSARSLPMPKEAAVVAPEREDIYALVDALPGQHQIIAALALGAGVRLAEALAVRPSDVDEDAMVLHVRRQVARRGVTLPKGEKTRQVPIPASLVAQLQRHARDYRLSPSGTYAAITPRRWAKVWAQARAKAGVELEGAHQLRHAFGSYHIAAGETVANVSAWMGHAKVSTTLTYYVHAMPNARPSTDLLARPAASARKSRTNRALRAVG